MMGIFEVLEINPKNAHCNTEKLSEKVVPKPLWKTGNPQYICISDGEKVNHLLMLFHMKLSFLNMVLTSMAIPTKVCISLL
jgi:hypothetical protein